MSKLKNESAFPHERVTERTGDGAIKKWVNCNGMSKRFYAACAAMQGILASPGNEPKSEETFPEYYRKLVKASYMLADELLKQEQDGIE